MTATDSYLLALDAGTSAVKAVLFDPEGRQQAAHVEEYVLEHPAPGFVELDPDVYWRAAQAAIAGVLCGSGVPPDAVAALGVTSQGETLIVLGRDGRPLRKAIVWLDNRAETEARDIADAFDADEVYRITGQHEIVPGWTAAKILWLRRHEPEVFAQAATFLLVEDYLVYRLTGNIVTDHALCPSTLYYNLVAGDWWDGMLEFLGIRRTQLPELFYSGTPVGVATSEAGLGRAIPVVTAPIDQVAGAVGAGNLAPGGITETTGSVLAVCATCAGPHYDPQRRVDLFPHAAPGAFVLLPWVPAGGLFFRWFRDALGGGLGFGELEREARSIAPGADGLMALPHIGGALLPDARPEARAVFHGVGLSHTRGHFVRAIFESVSFLLCELVDLLESMQVPVERVYSLGGGARSDLWLQIKADTLNREVVTVESDEVASLGAAVLAAVGAGLYPDLGEAVSHMVRFGRRFAPNPETANVYADARRRYQELNRVLLPMSLVQNPAGVFAREKSGVKNSEVRSQHEEEFVRM